MANPSNGPKLTDYGSRYYTDSLTKTEQKELHKWRMKNDPEYKDKVKSDRIRKKAAAQKASTKKTPTKKAPAKPAVKPKASVPRTRGGSGMGGMFGVKNR